MKNNLDTSFDLTICEVIFGIPISYNPTINAINFLIILGKWYINNVKTLNKELSMSSFLKFVNQKVDKIFYIKATNDIMPKACEIVC